MVLLSNSFSAFEDKCHISSFTTAILTYLDVLASTITGRIPHLVIRQFENHINVYLFTANCICTFAFLGRPLPIVALLLQDSLIDPGD
jgi:hypothetical protein